MVRRTEHVEHEADPSLGWTASAPGTTTEAALKRDRLANELKGSFEGYLTVFTVSTEFSLELQNYDKPAVDAMTPAVACKSAYECFMNDRLHNRSVLFDSTFELVYSQLYDKLQAQLNPEGN